MSKNLWKTIRCPRMPAPKKGYCWVYERCSRNMALVAVQVPDDKGLRCGNQGEFTLQMAYLECWKDIDKRVRRVYKRLGGVVDFVDYWARMV